MKKFSTLM